MEGSTSCEGTTKPEYKESIGKKVGRRGKWSSATLDDFIDIVVNNENYIEKLIFRNTKYQQNGIIYEKILNELKIRCSARGEKIEFNVSQLRNKFKKCVSDCKKAALIIKTATGVQRFQEEKGYGVWFNQLFALIRTRDSCKPEKATEPSASNKDAEDNAPEKVYVPVRSRIKDKKKDQEKTISEVVDVVKSMIDKDPMKDLVNLMREEMRQSREHELMMLQLMLNGSTSTSNFQAQGQIPDTPQSFQQNLYYQSNVSPSGFMNGVNQLTAVSRPEFLHSQQSLYAEAFPYGPHAMSSSGSSERPKKYQQL